MSDDEERGRGKPGDPEPATAPGQSSKTEELLPQVYDELRRLAEQHLAHERAGHTLQPTALAHEAYLRLLGSGGIQWDSRNHFLGAAARAIRRILVDHARMRGRIKRGGGAAVVRLDEEMTPAAEPSEELIALDEALEQLAAMDPMKAQLVEMRFFGGLTVGEAAETLGISEREAAREWRFARSWIAAQLQGGEEPGRPRSETKT